MNASYEITAIARQNLYVVGEDRWTDFTAPTVEHIGDDLQGNPCYLKTSIVEGFGGEYVRTESENGKIFDVLLSPEEIKIEKQRLLKARDEFVGSYAGITPEELQENPQYLDTSRIWTINESGYRVLVDDEIKESIKQELDILAKYRSSSLAVTLSYADFKEIEIGSGLPERRALFTVEQKKMLCAFALLGATAVNSLISHSGFSHRLQFEQPTTAVSTVVERSKLHATTTTSSLQPTEAIIETTIVVREIPTTIKPIIHILPPKTVTEEKVLTEHAAKRNDSIVPPTVHKRHEPKLAKQVPVEQHGNIQDSIAEVQAPHIAVNNIGLIKQAEKFVKHIDNIGPGHRGQDEALSDEEIVNASQFDDETYARVLLGNQKFNAVLTVDGRNREITIPFKMVRDAHYSQVLKNGKTPVEMLENLLKSVDALEQAKYKKISNLGEEQTAIIDGLSISEKQKSFIKDLVPAIQQAGYWGARINSEVVLSQAVLESGYGRHIRANNVFGVKAGSSWKGDTVVITTHEYMRGKRIKIDDVFRAYPSMEAAVEDYATLIARRPGYAGAVANYETSQGYLKGLIDGKYATDPHYKSKINRARKFLHTSKLF